jgi:carboxymethylenebutenolidase
MNRGRATNGLRTEPDTMATLEEPVDVETPDGHATGLVYRAPDGQPRPGAIFLTDIGGIRPAMREAARRVADAGYTVLLPNIFYRTGEPPFLAPPVNMTDPKARQMLDALRAGLPPEAIERDGAAYVRFLAAQSATAKGPLGVVGYCFSGAVALRIAAAQPDRIAAAASFHGGGLYTDAPTSPHLVLPRVKARLYFGHAVEDRSMPAAAIEKFEQALQQWGGVYESEIYDGAYHSWTATDSPVYNRPQAERAFRKLVELLGDTLRS